jgi:hypothetical protein
VYGGEAALGDDVPGVQEALGVAQDEHARGSEPVGDGEGGIEIGVCEWMLMMGMRRTMLLR